MEKQDIKPHKWAKEIIAWANGAKIEGRKIIPATTTQTKDTVTNWYVVNNPTWVTDLVGFRFEYRIYDPLREVKEAFDRGETIQGRMDNFSMWIDFSNNLTTNLTTLSVDSIKNSNGWEWRIKPTDNLEEGKDYIHNDGDYLIINRSGYGNNLGFTQFGSVFRCDLFCSNPEAWREVTKEEVKEFFERHLIKRYGEDWRNVKIKECMRNDDEFDEYTNKGINSVDIDKYAGVWNAWNKNGCLFNGKEWAEVLEEEIGFDNWKICDNFGERVFRHNRTSTGNNLKWRKATKQEVLSAPNYDGSATHQEFPFEVGDKVIARWAERPEVLTLKESIGKHKFKSEECGEGSYIDAGTDTWCYATEQEINIPKKVEYVPFEREDKEQFRGKWIKRKEGDLEMKITSFGTLTTNTFLIEGKCSKYLFENFTFLDGTPFGKIEQ